MIRGRIARNGALVWAVALATACASTPEKGASPPSEDRTDDPEFVAAREAARPEFESQADALAAGVYERFVHPDSVRPIVEPRPDRGRAREAPSSAAERAGDPSTAELLGTLTGEARYDRTEPPRPTADPPASEPAGEAEPRADESGIDGVPIGGDASEGSWTLQLGAYTSEAGALVRIRQLERDFPRIPRWYAGDDGLWRVYLGRWPDREGAERARSAVATRGYSDAWVTLAP